MRLENGYAVGLLLVLPGAGDGRWEEGSARKINLHIPFPHDSLNDVNSLAIPPCHSFDGHTLATAAPTPYTPSFPLFLLRPCAAHCSIHLSSAHPHPHTHTHDMPVHPYLLLSQGPRPRMRPDPRAGGRAPSSLPGQEQWRLPPPGIYAPPACVSRRCGLGTFVLVGIPQV